MKKIVVIILAVLIVSVGICFADTEPTEVENTKAVKAEPVEPVEVETEEEYTEPVEDISDEEVEAMTGEECIEWNYTHQDSDTFIDVKNCTHPYMEYSEYYEEIDGVEYEGIEADCPTCGFNDMNWNNSRHVIVPITMEELKSNK